MSFINLEKKILKFKFLEVISILSICWAIYQFYLNFDALAGDAEIHLIYAKNFVNGHFLEFNPGYKTGGESSFIYFLIVSIIYKFLGIYTIYAMKLISILSIAWILYKVYEINPSKSVPIKLIGVSILSVIGLISMEVMLGMENIFFAAILITFLSQEIKFGIKFENKGVILKSILLFLLRPEGLAYPLFLSIKSFFINNKKLLIYSLLSFFLCGISYYFLSIMSGGNYHNAGSIRRYMSTLPIYNINNININLFGYNLSLGILILRNLIYTYPIIFCLIIFRKFISRVDQIIGTVFILLPFSMHFLNFLPIVHFPRYFLYSYCLLFLLFAARIIPNMSISFIALIGILYLSGSFYTGMAHNHKFLKCSEPDCQINNRLWNKIKLRSPENVKKQSDEIYKKLSKDENDIVDIGTSEVQIRNLLDERFRVWSLDGIVDRELKKFKGKDYIDHFKYIEFRDIDYLAELPNFNRRRDFPSLKDFADDLNKSTPSFCTTSANINTVKTDECILKNYEKLISKCIRNKKLEKTDVKSWLLNVAGWNGGWLWKVQSCK